MTVSFNISTLNPQQRKAVLTTEGPVLVLAGAGSGKTRVITQRIAHLIAQHLAEPEAILAVTFTNKAAQEMRERVATLIGSSAANKVHISTFHSYCLHVLRKHAGHLGYRSNFSICAESDARILLRRVVDDLASQENLSLAELQSQISLYKSANETPGSDNTKPVVRDLEIKYQESLPDVYQLYQSALKAANAIDFDDLLLLTLRLWQEKPYILEACRMQFKYILVDEYQDTNKVQFALLQQLAAAHQNLCVVGDDDQSIYAWRGADSQIILEFEKHFQGTSVITLDQNYRSTTNILNAANAVISHNSVRKKKQLWSSLGRGREIDWFVTGDEEEEAKHAVAWLQFIQERTGARYRDFALLYRSNQQSRPLELAFRQAGIPYVVYGGQDFFERAEVKDIIAYFKVLVNPRDEAAFLRAVNMPRRGIGDGTLHQVHDICREEGLSLGKALWEMLKRDLAPVQAAQGIRDFLGLVQQFRKRFKEFKESGQTLRTVAEDLVLAIDYHSELQRVCKTPGQAHKRWLNVEAVLKALGDYEERSETPSLANFLDESYLNSDQDRFGRKERRQDGVSLMTIHSAKGLEFPFVFVMGLEEGQLPHEKSLRDHTIEEERRLFYVALTRGMRHVTLFEALSRTRFGKERMTDTSRFIKEIPQDLLKQQIKAVREMVADKVAPAKSEKPRARRKKSAVHPG